MRLPGTGAGITALAITTCLAAAAAPSLAATNEARVRGLSLYKGQQIVSDGLHPGWFERIEQSYYEAIDAFLKSIEKGTPPSPSLEDGLEAQLIADKATESLKTGQAIRISK